MKQGINESIDRDRMAIEGALSHPEILKKLNVMGYDRKRLQEGKALLEKVSMLQSSKNYKYSEQKSAYDKLRTDIKVAWKTYIFHVTVARLAFQDNQDLWQKLQLSGTRNRTLAGWLPQASDFYRNVAEGADAMARMGVTADVLAQAQAMIEAIAELRKQHKFCRGAAQQATQDRNQAMRELRQWMKHFSQTARLALQGQDQLLESLGFLIKA